jgi:hypothetical protein
MITKTRFSARYGFNPQQPSEGIVEDAPDWTRKLYLSDVLNGLRYIDKDDRSQYRNTEYRPLATKVLTERFCRWMRREEPDEYHDSWYCIEKQNDLITTCAWYFFYDFVEMVGEELRTAPENIDPTAYINMKEWESHFGFDNYPHCPRGSSSRS